MSVEAAIRRTLARAFTSLSNEEYVNVAEVADKILKQVSKIRVGDMKEVVDKHVTDTLFENIGDWTLNELMAYIWEETKAEYTEWEVLQQRPIQLRRPYSTFITYARLPEVIVDLRQQFRHALQSKAQIQDNPAVYFDDEVKPTSKLKITPPRMLRPYYVKLSQPENTVWNWEARLKYPVSNGGDDHLQVELTLLNGSPALKVFQDNQLKMTIVGHADGVAIQYVNQDYGIEVHGLEGAWILLDRKNSFHTGHLSSIE